MQRGLVGSRPNEAQADPDRTLGPGELFPVGALSAGSSTTRVFNALHDTVCLLLARDDFLSLREQSPEFERFCTEAITETLRQSLESLYGQYRLRANEQQTLTRTLGELVRHAPVCCVASASLREAAQRMADAKVRTIVVVDEAGTPVGMVTLVDLLRRVLLPERPLSTPVADVMSTPIVTLPVTTTASEALYVMADRGIRQVVVVGNGRPVGVINERDLFALQRISMRQVIEGLHAARSITDLRRAAEDIRGLTQNLLAQGVVAEPLTRTIAALERCARAARDRAGARAAPTDRHALVLARTGQRRAAASRRSPPTRTTRCFLPRRTPMTRSDAARSSSRGRARSTSIWQNSGSPSAPAT